MNQRIVIISILKRSDGQLKRKAGEALSSEDESRKKINNNDIEVKILFDT